MSDGARRGRSRADEFSAADVDIQIAALDQQSRLPGVTRLRAWALAALAPRPGERVLDVGAGTGDHAAELAGTGAAVTGLDPSPGLRAEAARRAPAATFVGGDAHDLPFADGTFDAVTCERVFQHLADPARAAAEIARVLRPGGRCVVTDTDWATAIIHPGDPGTLRSLTDAMLGGIANPTAGRRIAGQLTAAGLTVADTGSQALIQPPEAATGVLVRMLARMAVERGAIDQAEGDRFLAGLATAAETGDFHMSVTMFAVLAVRA